MNLSTNAAQAFENKTGVIEMSRREIETGNAELLRYHDLVPGKYVVLTVKDTGKGIPPEMLERIFDPFCTTREAGGEEDDQITAMPRGTGTILFVDDEEDIVNLRTRMLSSLGYRVLPATSPEQALGYFTRGQEDIDLLITDHTMPRMTELQLATEIRALKPELPIILCSGYSEAVTPEEALQAGVHRFLAKPVGLCGCWRLPSGKFCPIVTGESNENFSH